MKVKICNIDAYNKFIIGDSEFNSFSFKGYKIPGLSNYLDIQKLSKGRIDDFLKPLKSFPVNSKTTLVDLSQLIWPNEKIFKVERDNIAFLTYNFLYDEKDYVKREFYCYQVSDDRLLVQQAFDFYQLEDDFLIVFNEINFGSFLGYHENGTLRFANEGRSVYPIIKEKPFKLKNCIDTQIVGTNYGGGYLNGILLYTDENSDLATSIRKDYKLLGRLAYTSLKLLEQHYVVNWKEFKQYWTSKLDSTLYYTFNFLGFTNFKPYDKKAIIGLISKYNIDVSDLPCLVIFGKMDKNELIVIKVQEDLGDLFTLVSPIINQAKKEIEKEIEDLKENIILEFPLIEAKPITAPLGTPERKQQWEEQEKDILRQRAEGRVSRGGIRYKAEEIYKKRNYGKESFSYFTSKFLYDLDTFKSDGRGEYKDSKYELRGNTIFINFHHFLL